MPSLPSLGQPSNSLVQSSVPPAVQNRRMTLGVPTAFSLIVDCSGSMYNFVDDVEQGVTNLIMEQAANKINSWFSLAQFDHDYEVIFDNKPIQEVNAKVFEDAYDARGATAINDALVQATHDMEENLKKMDNPPKKVVVALITDGGDNMSGNSTEKVSAMIKNKEEQGWEYLFLGTEANTMYVAEQLGISAGRAAQYLPDQVQNGIGLLSEKFTQARGSLNPLSITDAERFALTNGKEL